MQFNVSTVVDSQTQQFGYDISVGTEWVSKNLAPIFEKHLQKFSNEYLGVPIFWAKNLYTKSKISILKA